MTNERPVYILPLVNSNVYWPVIGHLCCMASFFIRHYKLLHYIFYKQYTLHINLYFRNLKMMNIQESHLWLVLAEIKEKINYDEYILPLR